MHSLLETRVDRTLGGEEPVQTFVHRLEPGVGLFALRLAHGRPSLGRLGISREAIRSTAAALLPQRADARSSQLVLAPRGRCAPAGRPPAVTSHGARARVTVRPRSPSSSGVVLMTRFRGGTGGGT